MLTFLSARILFLKRLPVACLVPAIAGCTMLIASFLPWLRTPFGQSFSAWQLPLDLGFQTAFLNYGLLCLGSACYSFFLAVSNWNAVREGKEPYRSMSAAWLCLMPIVLFLLQYVYLDFGAISLLAQQKTQMLLIQGHYGYNVGPDLFPLTGLTVDIESVQGRFQLLVDQMRVGTLVPFLSIWMLLDYKWLFRHPSFKKRLLRPWMRGVLALSGLVLIVMFVRAAGWAACMKLAANDTSPGSQEDALQWLDRALFFDPSLNQVAFYHIERGQVLHVLYPNRQSDDSRTYLIAFFIQKKDYAGAYRQLLPVWQKNHTTPWVVEEMSNLIERRIEYIGPAQVAYLPKDVLAVVQSDNLALSWLHILMQTDPQNLYGQYMLGRIAYDLHDYASCKSIMLQIMPRAHNADFESSIYTYIALSEAGMGNYASERVFLLDAVQLDPTYRNNTAREELSGLH